MTTLFRKRLIPSECVNLKDDTIIHIDDEKIITSWKTFRPNRNSHTAYLTMCLRRLKISKFYKQDNSLAYIYCDIIDTSYDKASDTYVFTDLLADVIIENSGFVRVVDLDELADACSGGLISNDMLVSSLHKLNNLLSTIYGGTFSQYIDVLERYEQDNISND